MFQKERNLKRIKVYQTVDSGLTPLQLLFDQKGVQIWIKRLDLTEPSGSAKDYLAAAMVEALVDKHHLQKGAQVVTVGSGNTGAALSYYFQQYGIGLTVITPPGQNPGDILNMQRLGIKVLTQGTPEAQQALQTMIIFDQSEDESALKAAEFIGDEIWDQLLVKTEPITLVGGFGSGITLMGTSQSLKAINPGCRTIATQPAGYTLDLFLAYEKAKTSGQGFFGQLKVIGKVLEQYLRQGYQISINADLTRPSDEWFNINIVTNYLSRVDGVGVATGGISVLAQRYLVQLVDQVMTINDDQTFAMTQQLYESGFAVSESTGLNLVAAYKLARKLLQQEKTGTIVILAHARLRDPGKIYPKIRLVDQPPVYRLCQSDTAEQALYQGLAFIYQQAFLAPPWNLNQDLVAKYPKSLGT